MGTPNREPQEYSRSITEHKDPGKYLPIISLLYSCGSLFGVPSNVPLYYPPELADGNLPRCIEVTGGSL